MSLTGNSASSTGQSRKSNIRIDMKKRQGGKTSLYKQLYANGGKNLSGEVSINERFVHACENGDYNTVNRILEEVKGFNIDVTDQLGRTAMRLAVENEHLEVVTLLLQYCDGQKMREALLLAIYLGHVQIAELCLRHPKFKFLNEKRFLNGDSDSFWQTPSSDDAQFAPDITPLILASQYNRTEIVQLLLRGGDRITKPHDYHCKCQECHNKFKFDSLRHAQSRLNAYRGLASESYISLASIDPIVTAFELGHELRNLSGKEKYFKNEYTALADHLSTYAVKLLDKVRGHKELDCVLGKTGKETEEKYFTLARLDLAIKYQEKPFVAHSNCQQKLVEIWHNGIRKIFKLNQLFLFLLIFVYIILWPFACLVYIFGSWTKRTIKIQQLLNQPCIKFISHTISYAIFIILIILSSLLFSSEIKKNQIKLSNYNMTLSNILNYSIIQCQTSLYNCTYIPYYPDFYFRQRSPTWLDITITVFVIGFLWHEIKQIYSDGIRDYLLSWNNIVDSCMNILYITSFSLKYYVFIEVAYAVKRLSQNSFQQKVENVYKLNASDQWDVWYTFYWLNADRFYWVACDPNNVGEGLFAIANICSFSRICFLLPAFQHLGPLQISLGRMMSDIGKFIIIFMVIFCAFMFGLNNLFWYYSASVRGNVEILSHLDENNPLQAETFFGTMSETFKTVFWSLFGLSEKDGVLLGDYNNRFTETVGYLIYGTFNIASVIVLLNMLIAMMSKSYETIVEHADVEWKFARSKLYMEYIKEGASLPVPFNIVPTPKSIYYLYRRIFQCGKLRESEQQKINNEQLGHYDLPIERRFDINPTFQQQNGGGGSALGATTDGNKQIQQRRKSFEINQPLTYRKVMERVIKRFLLHKQREEQDEIREGDFDELKQDIQMLRFELMNRLEDMRDELSKTSTLLNDGIIVVGEQLSYLNRDINPNGVELFQVFKQNFEKTLEHIKSIDSGMDDTNTTRTESITSEGDSSSKTILSPSVSSLPNFNTNESISFDSTSTSVLLHTSHSVPNLLKNEDNKNDLRKILSNNVLTEKTSGFTRVMPTVNPIQAIRSLSSIKMNLIEPIAEENSDNLDDDLDEMTTSMVQQEQKNSLQVSEKIDINDDIDIEIDAAEQSCQTSDQDVYF